MKAKSRGLCFRMGLENFEKKKKTSDFEEKIVISLLIAIALFGILLLDNINSTGFAVALSPEANFSLGLGVWIVLLILVGIWGYFVLRKYIKSRIFKKKIF